MNRITYYPIGIVHSPFRFPEGTPIQPVTAKDIHATIEIFQEYRSGLTDLDGFSHVIILFHMHLAKGKSLLVTPFMDTKPHGVFATRSPGRPNPIGMSVVRLEKIENNLLFVKDIDILDGSPVLDIKPYIPEFDIHEVYKSGWFEKNIHKLGKQKDDGRFKI